MYVDLARVLIWKYFNLILRSYPQYRSSARQLYILPVTHLKHTETMRHDRKYENMQQGMR